MTKLSTDAGARRPINLTAVAAGEERMVPAAFAQGYSTP